MWLAIIVSIFLFGCKVQEKEQKIKGEVEADFRFGPSPEDP